MKVLIVGGSGQLGRCLQDRLPEHWQVCAPSSAELDISSEAQVQALFRAHADHPFDIIINASSYNAVDAAESDADKAFAINAHGPACLAKAALGVGGRLFHVSTDYVFSGEQSRPYTEADIPAPLGAYGRSKLAGELAVLTVNPDAIVIRTAWLYSEYGRNFVKTMLALAASGRALTVVDDQVGTPTYAGDLAQVIIGLAGRPDVPGGLYHYAGGDIVSWYAFAQAILAGLAHQLSAIGSSQYPTAARRPRYSALACPKLQALGFAPKSQAPNLARVRRRVASCDG